MRALPSAPNADRDDDNAVRPPPLTADRRPPPPIDVRGSGSARLTGLRRRAASMQLSFKRSVFLGMCVSFRGFLQSVSFRTALPRAPALHPRSGRGVRGPSRRRSERSRSTYAPQKGIVFGTHEMTAQ
jgi:hypothetical protein